MVKNINISFIAIYFMFFFISEIYAPSGDVTLDCEYIFISLDISQIKVYEKSYVENT